MINDLDETLKQLLIQKAQLDPAEVDISFDTPTRDWSTPVTRPTINLYLFEIRENRTLRELDWDDEPSGYGQMRRKRLPLRMDLSYMVTCWTSATEDQHRLLWHVLETFFRHSPLPEDVLQGALRHMLRPVRTEVAQPDGVLKNVSEPGNQLGGDRWRECWKACVQPLPCGSAADPLCPSCFGYCCKNHRLTGLFARRGAASIF